jgi:hypothetical protein
MLRVDASVDPELLLSEAALDAKLVNAGADLTRSPVDPGTRTRLRPEPRTPSHGWSVGGNGDCKNRPGAALSTAAHGGRTIVVKGNSDLLYRRAFPRPDLYFVAHEESAMFPLSDVEVMNLLTGEFVHDGWDHLNLGEVQCTWIETGAGRARSIGFKSMRWARIPLTNGCASPEVIRQSRAALTGPRPILDSFGPHEKWAPTASEREIIDLELASRTGDFLWMVLAMGLGFEFDGHPQELRARVSASGAGRRS